MSSRSLTSTFALTLAFTLTILLVASCKPKQPVEHPVVVAPQPPAAAACGTISRGAATYKDPLTQLTGSLDGDCLRLKYSYGGGCQEHDLDVYWGGTWAETIPPGTHLYVSHNANGDACKALKSGIADFDLKPLRYQGVGQVVVDVLADELPLVRINYTY